MADNDGNIFWPGLRQIVSMFDWKFLGKSEREVGAPKPTAVNVYVPPTETNSNCVELGGGMQSAFPRGAVGRRYGLAMKGDDDDHNYIPQPASEDCVSDRGAEIDEKAASFKRRLAESGSYASEFDDRIAHLKLIARLMNAGMNPSARRQPTRDETVQEYLASVSSQPVPPSLKSMNAWEFLASFNDTNLDERLVQLDVDTELARLRWRLRDGGGDELQVAAAARAYTEYVHGPFVDAMGPEWTRAWEECEKLIEIVLDEQVSEPVRRAVLSFMDEIVASYKKAESFAGNFAFSDDGTFADTEDLSDVFDSVQDSRCWEQWALNVLCPQFDVASKYLGISYELGEILGESIPCYYPEGELDYFSEEIDAIIDAALVTIRDQHDMENSYIVSTWMLNELNRHAEDRISSCALAMAQGVRESVITMAGGADADALEGEAVRLADGYRHLSSWFNDHGEMTALKRMSTGVNPLQQTFARTVMKQVVSPVGRIR